MNLVDKVNSLHMNENPKNLPNFKSGDTIAVSVKITEGAKSRIQLFQGIVIAMKNPKTINGHFRVRKISNGLGVERVFPFHSPNVTDIKVLSRGKTRRAKHFYLRERSGKAARIKVDYDRKD